MAAIEFGLQQAAGESGADGLITIDTNLQDELPLPVVAIAGHRQMSRVTNVVIDHQRAAKLSLRGRSKSPGRASPVFSAHVR